MVTQGVFCFQPATPDRGQMQRELMSAGNRASNCNGGLNAAQVNQVNPVSSLWFRFSKQKPPVVGENCAGRAGLGERDNQPGQLSALLALHSPIGRDPWCLGKAAPDIYLRAHGAQELVALLWAQVHLLSQDRESPGHTTNMGTGIRLCWLPQVRIRV